jgi:glycosyltransferase involved in cell wall biosynthesis
VSQREYQSSAPDIMSPPVEVSILMPCLNEAETLGKCIGKAQWYLKQHHIQGEIIIADNGSIDGSQDIARQWGARVVPVYEKGYGNALRGGILAAKGCYVIMGDADDSYDFTELSPFLQKLRSGYDLVMGNRFQGGIHSGAMPILHQYLGNPILSWLGRLLFSIPCGDFHCGLRGFRKEAIQSLDLRTTGMEFASEMVVKAALFKLYITEVPTTLSPDGRSRAPHLRTWRDGWRHLRFLLLYSPKWLFLYPGLMLMAIGLFGTIWLMWSPRVHTLLYAAASMNIGFQIVIFAIFTKAFGISEGLLPEDKRLSHFLRYITLEVGLLAGGSLIGLGLLWSTYAFHLWRNNFFGTLDPAVTMRIVIPSITCLALGVQVVFSSFFLSILSLRRRRL